ncbi:MAG: hypothetical protein KAG61_09460 [Bacteriovoracaceae bacterium]|nr:hypothetical protein [Bacteriovoracaceae bacterium]
MKQIIFIFAILSPFICLANIVEKNISKEQKESARPVTKVNEVSEIRGPMISSYYRSGSNLVYDCEDQHFACVDLESFGKCETWRSKAVDRVEDFMPCAPLKKFKSDEECRRAHYNNIYAKIPKKFCIRTKKED